MSTTRSADLGAAPQAGAAEAQPRVTALDRLPDGRGWRARPIQQYARFYMPVLTLLALAVFWEFAVDAFDIPRFILPAPSSIVEAVVDNRAQLWSHTLVTLSETLAGFGLAIAVSLPLAILIVYSRLLRDAIYPLILLTQAVPKVAVAPVLLLALGYGQAPKIVVAFLVCFFPIIINTAAGLASVPEDRLLLARSLCASEFDVFRKIRFPTALPVIFVGLKVGVTLAVIGAVVGELVGADRGLGYLILIATANARTGLAYAAILALAVMSILLFYAVAWLERVAVPWARTDN